MFARKTFKLLKQVAPEKKRSELEKIYQNQVDTWEMLHKHKVSDEIKQKMVKISRATYYRRKKFLRCPILKSKRPKNFRQSRFGSETTALIRRIRTENPTYGQQKICVIMRRDFGCKISESSVGRIMKRLHLPRSISAPAKKKSRRFNRHAQRFKFKKYNEMTIGENVQIDHMTVSKNGCVFKHFAAWERFSKYLFANAYSNAKSSTAAQFLRELVAKIPYKIKSIQVDGGSEFMKDFEKACEELDIPLVVLPPATQIQRWRREMQPNLSRGILRKTSGGFYLWHKARVAAFYTKIQHLQISCSLERSYPFAVYFNS